MEFLVWLGLIGFIGLIFFTALSFTGGLAGAIHARGREDRSLVANAGVGVAGTIIASIVWRLATGEWPAEASIGLWLLSIGCSIVFIHYLEWRQGRKHSEGVAATSA